MPLRLGDRNEAVRTWRATMNLRFGPLYTRLRGPLPTNTDEFGPRAVEWQKEYEVRTGQVQDGVVSNEDLIALGITPPVIEEPDCVAFSVGGAGSRWNIGYQFDMVERAVRPDKCFTQHLGYDTRPVPMNRGVQEGIGRLIEELDRPRGQFGLNCTVLPWTGVWYSMGALVGRTVLDRVLWGDLGRFKATFLGDVAIGNPRRQRDHNFPGVPAEWGTGEGISTPTDHDLPWQCYDLAADRDMRGSGGDDLYTKMADDENERTVKNMRAVWDIINKGNPKNLAAAVILLMASPSFTGTYAAAVAAIKALNFFVVQGTGPHVRYHITYPVPNDPRDSWEIGRAHIAGLVAAKQPIYAVRPAA